MQVHHISNIPTLLMSESLGRVNKRLTEPDPIIHVVTTPSPLPALHVVLSIVGHITATVLQVTDAARMRGGMNNSGT